VAGRLLAVIARSIVSGRMGRKHQAIPAGPEGPSGARRGHERGESSAQSLEPLISSNRYDTSALGPNCPGSYFSSLESDTRVSRCTGKTISFGIEFRILQALTRAQVTSCPVTFDRPRANCATVPRVAITLATAKRRREVLGAFRLAGFECCPMMSHCYVIVAASLAR